MVPRQSEGFDRRADVMETLLQCSWSGRQSVDGPDGEQRDGGECQQPAQSSGPGGRHQAFTEPEGGPAHQGEHKGGGAHSWGQVLPAQLEDGQWGVADHVLYVGREALGPINPANGQ